MLTTTTQQAPALWRRLRSMVEPGDSPHHVANSLLRATGVNAPFVDVDGIASKLGVRVKYLPNPGWIGAVDPTIDPATIWVDNTNARVRQRFTLAHELGHLMLHPLTKAFRDTTLARPGDVVEEAANEFAAALLMPLWMLEPAVTKRRRTTEELARMFHVSSGAMHFQLAKLR